jgi:cytochrome c2
MRALTMKISRVPLIVIGVLLAATALGGCGNKAEHAEAATRGNAERGRALVQKFGCASCHTIPGVHSERGLVGPPLAHLGQRAIIAGSLPNTVENMEQWIMHPHRFNPKSAMPELGVTPEQARDITAYLYSQ